MLLYVKDVINLLKTFDQNAILLVSTDPDSIDKTLLSRCFTTSTLNFDKKHYNFGTDVLDTLPDKTKTVTIFLPI